MAVVDIKSNEESANSTMTGSNEEEDANKKPAAKDVIQQMEDELEAGDSSGSSKEDEGDQGNIGIDSDSAAKDTVAKESV